MVKGLHEKAGSSTQSFMLYKNTYAVMCFTYRQSVLYAQRNMCIRWPEIIILLLRSFYSHSPYFGELENAGSDIIM